MFVLGKKKKTEAPASSTSDAAAPAVVEMEEPIAGPSKAAADPPAEEPVEMAPPARVVNANKWTVSSFNFINLLAFARTPSA